MKKKGLIVATIVMVLVLAVSLTTATYAWFTTTAQTTIDSIGIKAAAGAKVKIGMSKTNAYVSNADADSFVSGELQIISPTTDDTCGWDGDPGLGVSLSTPLALDNISEATGYGTPAELTYTKDATPKNEEGHYYLEGGDYIPCPKAGEAPTETYTRTVVENTGIAGQFIPGTSTGKQIVTASGNSKDEYDASSVTAATINEDYLHFTIGVAPSEANIDTITLNMFVNPSTAKTTLGVEAALYFYYRVNDAATWTKVEVYQGFQYNTVKANMGNEYKATNVGQALTNAYGGTYTDTTTLNDGYVLVPVTVGTKDTAFAIDQITQIEFYIFYDGTDADCINAALGSSCEIIFSVTNTTITVAP